jgi:multiple sugar transport system substrate-binding protein
MSVLVMVALVLGACAAPPTPAPAAQPPTAKPTDAPPVAPSAEKVELQYWLWDNLQLPAYQACADAFTKQNPNITIKISQQGWGQYWDAITAGFVSGTAPDVFTNHLAKYPEFLNKKQLLDIEPMVTADNVNLKQYIVDASLWAKDGKRYGLPKDWDTIAVFYNADMLKAAGIDPAIMKTWTWNPQDGGIFQETIAKLTLDDKGRNGLDPNFDKNNVVQWGFAAGAGDPGTGGQTEWSAFAASNGFKLTDGPWATAFYYDDPKVAETLQWWSDLNQVKGFAPGSDSLAGSDNKGLFQGQKVAMTTDGSWQINNLLGSKFPVGIGMLPKGPVGLRSPINGLSDAIWSGTKHPNEAWQWVRFLASPECANIVGDFGVVFPAIQSGVDKALAAHKAKGADVSGFTDIASAPDGTFLLPMTDHGSEIASLVAPVLLDIFDGKVKAAEALPGLNEQINALFK